MWQQFPDSHDCNFFHRKECVETFLVHQGPDKKNTECSNKYLRETESLCVCVCVCVGGVHACEISTYRKKQLPTHIHSWRFIFPLQDHNMYRDHLYIRCKDRSFEVPNDMYMQELPGHKNMHDHLNVWLKELK